MGVRKPAQMASAPCFKTQNERANVMPTETKYIVIRESIIASILTDIVTFGSIFAVMYLNHLYLDGSVIIDVMLSLCVMVGLAAVKKRNNMTANEAIAYLNKHKEPKFKLTYHIVRIRDGRISSTHDSYDSAIKELERQKNLKRNLVYIDGYEIKIGTRKIKE